MPRLFVNIMGDITPQSLYRVLGHVSHCAFQTNDDKTAFHLVSGQSTMLGVTFRWDAGTPEEERSGLAGIVQQALNDIRALGADATVLVIPHTRSQPVVAGCSVLAIPHNVHEMEANAEHDGVTNYVALAERLRSNEHHKDCICGTPYNRHSKHKVPWCDGYRPQGGRVCPKCSARTYRADGIDYCIDCEKKGVAVTRNKVRQ